MRFLLVLALLAPALLVLAALGALADEEEAATGSLVVVVKAEGGGGIAQAEVTVWTEDEVWRATADGEGKAHFERLPPGEVSVLASASNRTATERHDLEIEAGETTEVELDLGAGVPFAGLVVGVDEVPIDGAYVEVRRGGTFEGYGESFADPTPYARARTDEAGHFFVDGIPPEGVATVVIQVEGYEEARVCVRAFGDVVRPSPLVIRLVKGGEITGTVTSPEGTPVKGAVVFVVPADHEQLRTNPRIRGWSSSGSSFEAWTARSDGNGVYRVEGLPLDEEYVVLADTTEHARSAWSAVFRPTAERRVATLDLALRRPGTLQVRMQVPEGHTLGWTRASLGAHMSGIDAEEGEEENVVIFRGLWPAAHTLTVEARDFLTFRTDVDVAEGATVEVEVLLDPGVDIEGVVLDPGGQGVEGVRVEAERKENDEEGWHDTVASRAETDAEGRFRLAGLRPGRHELTTWKRGFDLLAPVTVEAPTTGVVLQGVSLGTLVVRFVTPDGEVVTASEMVWRHTPGGGGGGSGESAKEGVFRFDGFRGKEHLTFDFEGFVRVRRDVDVKPGEHVDLGSVTLEVGRTLRGRVVDPDGRSVRGALVEHDDYTQATTDASGTFALPHLAEGEILVKVGAEGFLEEETTVVVGKEGKEVVLPLARGTLLEGVILDEKGEPWSEHWFQVQREDVTGAWKQDDYFSTDEDGAFSLRVKTGPCRIIFLKSREEEPIVLASIDGKEGETKPLELVLRLPAE